MQPFSAAKVVKKSDISKKLNDNPSNICILKGNLKKIADMCRQLADLIRRRGTGANKIRRIGHFVG